MTEEAIKLTAQQHEKSRADRELKTHFKAATSLFMRDISTFALQKSVAAFRPEMLNAKITEPLHPLAARSQKQSAEKLLGYSVLAGEILKKCHVVRNKHATASGSSKSVSKELSPGAKTML